jgi:hypothetical protein
MTFKEVLERLKKVAPQGDDARGLGVAYRFRHRKGVRYYATDGKIIAEFQFPEPPEGDVDARMLNLTENAEEPRKMTRAVLEANVEPSKRGVVSLSFDVRLLKRLTEAMGVDGQSGVTLQMTVKKGVVRGPVWVRSYRHTFHRERNVQGVRGALMPLVPEERP